MLYRRFLFLLIILLTFTACSSAPDTRPDTRPDRFEINPAMTPLEALDAAGPWIPESSSLVLVLSGAELWAKLNSQLLGLENSDEEFQAGTLGALESDLRELTKARLGVDLYDLDTIVVASGENEVTVIAFKQGDDFSLNLPKAEGREGVYSLSLTQWATGEIADGADETYGFSMPSLFVYPMETARPGVLFSLSGHLKETAWFGESSFLDSLAGVAIRDIFESIDQESTMAVLAGRGSDPNMNLIAGSEEISNDVDYILLAFGADLVVEVQGEKDQLDWLQSQVEEALEVAREEIGAAYRDRHQGEALAALSLIYSYHMTESVFSHLSPERSENRLRYQMPAEKITQSLVSMVLLIPYFVSAFRDDSLDDYEALEREMLEVLVAARDLEAGTELEEDMVVVKRVPERFLPSNPIFIEDLSSYIGRTLNQDVMADAMILRSDFEHRENEEIAEDEEAPIDRPPVQILR